MKFLFILLMIPSMVHAFECDERRDITSEKDQKLVFCTANELQLTQKCASQGKECQLIKDLAKKPEEAKLKEALKHTIVGTPGSRLCNLKGWTVLMGEMFDKSQVCTCKHPSGEFITCASLDSYYKK